MLPAKNCQKIGQEWPKSAKNAHFGSKNIFCQKLDHTNRTFVNTLLKFVLGDFYTSGIICQKALAVSVFSPFKKIGIFWRKSACTRAMKNISAKNLNFSENTTTGAHLDQIWALRQFLSLIYVRFKFLARMLFFSNSPYLSRLNFGKMRKNEIAAISSKMTFLHSVKSVVPEISYILTYRNFSEIYFSKWTPLWP